MLGAGIASVDYMLADYVDGTVNSLTTYFRLNWNIMENLALNSNLNYYHNNDIFGQKFRGGLTLQYKIKSGVQQ